MTIWDICVTHDVQQGDMNAVINEQLLQNEHDFVWEKKQAIIKMSNGVVVIPFAPFQSVRRQLNVTFTFTDSL